MIPQTIDYVEPEIDHKLRHYKMLREQVHDLDVTQSQMKIKIEELQNHRLNERLQSIETEQQRLANTNLNLSRQFKSLEKIHFSMLELFEDVADLQSKVDTLVPDLKHEISKLEFNAAQHESELNLIREENRNNIKSIQAAFLRLSNSQDNKERLEHEVDKLHQEIDKIKKASLLHRDIIHGRISKVS